MVDPPLTAFSVPRYAREAIATEPLVNHVRSVDRDSR
jgi:hypothetical protein